MYKSYYTNCFLNSKYYQEIKNNYKVLFTFLGGSRLLHCETASSDYDITIVVADDFEFSSITTSYLRFNDKIRVHWYIIPLSTILAGMHKDYLTNILFLELKYLSLDFVLDMVDTESYNKLVRIKDTISEKGKAFLLKKFAPIINSIDTKDYKCANKSLYYLLYISYAVLNEQSDLTLIKNFKKEVRTGTLTENTFIPVKQQLCKLKDYINVNK